MKRPALGEPWSYGARCTFGHFVSPRNKTGMTVTNRLVQLALYYLDEPLFVESGFIGFVVAEETVGY